MAERKHRADTYSSGAYGRLRDALKRYELPPGRALQLRELASRYDISNMPMREALHRLYEAGFVDHVAGQGFSVKMPDPEELRELHELATTLLGRGCELILANDEQVERTRALIAHAAHEVEAALALAPGPRGLQAAQVVEEGIREFLSLSGNRVFVQQVSNALDRTHFVRRVELDAEDRLAELLRTIRDLDAAVQRGDATAARAVIQRDSQISVEQLPSLISTAIGRLYTPASLRR